MASGTTERKEPAMLLKRLALTAAAGAALVVALPAIADAPYWSHGYRGGHWHHDRYHRDYHRHRHIHRHGHREKVVVINERPYASAPPIVVLNPSPVYAPYPSSGPSQPGWDVNVGFRFGGSF
jgi:hypothetical protein